MKIPFALLCSLLLVTWARSQSTDTGAYPPKASAEKPAAQKKADAAKKEDEIKGVVVSRGTKGFLGVEIVNSNFKISFYDAKRKPVSPDVARAVLRWDPKYKVGKDRVVLTRAEDGKSLTAGKPIRAPYNFKLYITLVNDATETEEPVGESYVIDFRA